MNREEVLAKYAADKDLRYANLFGANLFGANLFGANLSGADLSEADLSEANLSGANLSGVCLFGANLSGANLFGANLSGANLSGADLSRADLSRADLSEAYLSGANLSGANYNPILLLCQLYWSSLPSELRNLAMNFDCQNHPDGRAAFQKWLDIGECPYFSTNMLRAVQFAQAKACFSFIDEPINPLQLFRALCAEKKITL